MGWPNLFAHLNPGGRKPKPKSGSPEKAGKKTGKGVKPRAEDPADDEEGDGDGDEEDDPDTDADAADGDEEDGDKDEKADADADTDAADGDDDEEQVSAEATAAISRAAVKAERKRCASIFGDPAAANNVALACELAFGTNLSAKRVVSIMKQGAPAAKGGGLGAAMRGVKVPQLGNDGGRADGGGGEEATKALAAAIDSRNKDRGGAK